MVAGALVMLWPLLTLMRANRYQSELLAGSGALTSPELNVPAAVLPVPEGVDGEAMPQADSLVVSKAPPTVAAATDPAVRSTAPARSAAPPATGPGPSVMRIEIPALQLRLAALVGVDATTLAKGPGRYPDSALPGAAGNVAFAGHRTQRGLPSFFYQLNRLQPGDEIRVVSRGRLATYTVERVFVVPPTAVEVVGPTPYPALTLTTCDPPGADDNRLIVRARWVATSPVEAAPGT